MEKKMRQQRMYQIGVLVVAIWLGALLVQSQIGLGETRAEGSSPVSVTSLADDEYLQPLPHPILSDVNMRRAVAYCTDKDALIAAAYPLLNASERAELVADGFIPKDSWAYVTPATVYPYDPDAGRTLLEGAGWLLPSGEDIRMKDGKQLALTLRTTDADMRLAFMPVFEQQMRVCGIRVIRSHVPFNEFIDKIVWRDFELTEFGWMMDPDEPGGLELYACDQIPAPENDWARGNNFMGWCNQDASQEISLANDTTLSEAERITHYQNFIDLFAEDVPSLPLFWREGAPTFEHIDFNFGTYLQQVEVTPGAEALLAYKHYHWTEGTVAVPEGAVTEDVSIGYYPLVNSLQPLPEELVSFDPFRLTVFKEGIAQDAYALEEPVTVTIVYPPVIGMRCQGCVDEATVKLYVWAGEAWEAAVDTCPADSRYENLLVESNTYQVNICHLSEFIMMGTPAYWAYLPMALR
jgi:peptide/nickel transport system substrate-binding protein